MQAVLFDLDGTLIDSTHGFCMAFNDVLRSMNLAPVEQEWVRQRLSGGARGMLAEYFDEPIDSQRVAALRLEFIEHYRANHVTNKVRPFSGINKLIHTLQAKKILWGIVTNKPRALTEPTLDYLGWQDCPVVICPDDVANAKPDPEGIHLACKTIGVSANQTLYVGDHIKDTKAAHNAGCMSIACRWGFYPDSSQPESWHAEFICDQSEQLLSLLMEQLNDTTLV